MGFQAGIDAITARWASNVPAGITTTLYDNEKVDSVPTDTKWARLTVQETTGEPITFGGSGVRKVRRTGLIGIQMFITAGLGDSTLRGLMDTAVAIYEGQTFSGVRCRTASGGTARLTPEKTHWMLTRSIPFYYDETF